MLELILAALIVGLIATVIRLTRNAARENMKRRRLEEHNAELIRLVDALSEPTPTGGAIADGFDELSDDDPPDS